jgi:hypothetical protein
MNVQDAERLSKILNDFGVRTVSQADVAFLLLGGEGGYFLDLADHLTRDYGPFSVAAAISMLGLKKLADGLKAAYMKARPEELSTSAMSVNELMEKGHKLRELFIAKDSKDLADQVDKATAVFAIDSRDVKGYEDSLNQLINAFVGRGSKQ